MKINTAAKASKSHGGKNGFGASFPPGGALKSDGTFVVAWPSEVTGSDVMCEDVSSASVWANIHTFFIFYFPFIIDYCFTGRG